MRSDHWMTQPRQPAGTPIGGEWDTMAGGGAATSLGSFDDENANGSPTGVETGQAGGEAPAIPDSAASAAFAERGAPRIDEDEARRAWYAVHMGDYEPGSATREHQQAVKRVADLAERRKRSVGERHHAELDALVGRYERTHAEYVNGRSRQTAANPSWFITGRSGRDATRANQALERQRAWESDMLGKLDRIQHRIESLGSGGVKSDEPDAAEQIRGRLARRVQRQERMKAANAQARRSGAQQPYPSYALTNNNAEIRRLRRRLASLEELQSLPASEQSGRFDTGDAYTLIHDTDTQRIAFEFDSKPTPATRDLLKRNGFKWAPSQGRWQRQLTDNALAATRRLTEAHQAER